MEETNKSGSLGYSESELNNLKRTAHVLGLDDVELGYGVCLKHGQVEDTELEILEDNFESDNGWHDTSV